MKKFLHLAAIACLAVAVAPSVAHAKVNCGTMTLKEAENLTKLSRAIESEAKMAVTAAIMEVGHRDLPATFFSLDGGNLIGALQYGSAMDATAREFEGLIAIRDQTTDSKAKKKLEDFLNEQVLSLRTRADFVEGGVEKLRKYGSKHWQPHLENLDKVSKNMKQYLKACTF